MTTSGLVVVCRPELAPGFALAGVRVEPVRSRDGGAAALLRARGGSDVGVILIEQEVLEVLPRELRRAFLRRPVPILLPFPGPSVAGAAAGPEAYIVELLRQAIGYRVRLR